MKSLVTGGTGFIGGHLVKRLKESGREVRCIVRSKAKAAGLERLGVDLLYGDLSDGLDWKTALDGVDEVIHLAGVTRAKSNEEYYRGNQLATRKLIEACLRSPANLRRLIHISSLAAVGPSQDGCPLREDAPYHPVSHYGRSKMMSELEVLRASDRIPITILRPSIVYGPSERDMFEYFRLVRKGIYPLIGYCRQLLNLIYCDDLIEAILQASESPRTVGEIYFVGSEQQYTADEIGDCIARVLECSPIRVHIPLPLVLAAGAVVGSVGKLTRRAVFFNLQKAREATQSAWICSVEKAKSHFGFRQQVSLEDGFRKTCGWYRTEGWLD